MKVELIQTDRLLFPFPTTVIDDLSPSMRRFECLSEAISLTACMLIANQYMDAFPGTSWETSFSIDSNGDIDYIPYSRHGAGFNFGERDVIASPDGWFASGADHLGEDTHDFKYRAK